MELHNPSMRLINAACMRRFIDVTSLLSNEKFLAEVKAKAAIYFANGDFTNDKRDLSSVEESTLIGELGEHSIVELCRKCNLESHHNDEKITHEKHWDVLIESLKGEIKFQGEGFLTSPKEFFSFNNKRVDELMRQKWTSYDFILAYYVKIQQDRVFVVPWWLIASEAINPERNLYVRSGMNSGFYLQDRNAGPTLVKRLNNNSHSFDFNGIKV